MEGLEVVELLAGTHKFDRLAGDRPDRQRRAAAGIAVELGEDDPVDAEGLIERLGDVDGVLAGHRVDHQQDLIRMDRLFDPLKLLHQHLVDVQTAGGIEDNEIVAVVLRVPEGRLGNLNRIGLTHLEDGRIGPLARQP